MYTAYDKEYNFLINFTAKIVFINMHFILEYDKKIVWYFKSKVVYIYGLVLSFVSKYLKKNYVI